MPSTPGIRRDETTPTARALLTLELLQVRPGITAAELADRLGVTDRAARRYVATLREAGVPVDAERGRHGGYRLGRGLRLPPLVFAATEALGLVMAALQAFPHAAADPSDPVGAALGKLLRALPESVAAPAALLRETAATSSRSPLPDRRADPELMSRLVAAVARRRRVLLGYTSEAGRSWETEADPWAVVLRHGRWYLLCRAHHVDAVRTYRIDRITLARELTATFEPPAGLDPVAAFETHLGQGWEFETRVAFDAPYDAVSGWVGPAMGRLTPLDGERCVLVGTTSNPAMYAGEWLAALPFRFEVEGGPQLRAAVAAVADRLRDSLGRADGRGEG